jgi:hypothetical protein
VPRAALLSVPSIEPMNTLPTARGVVVLAAFAAGLAIAGPVSVAIGVEETLIIGGVCLLGAALLIAALPAVRAVRDDHGPSQ